MAGMRSVQRDKQRQSDTKDDQWNKKMAVGKDGAKFLGCAQSVLFLVRAPAIQRLVGPIVLARRGRGDFSPAML
jgi:hypothetical protein